MDKSSWEKATHDGEKAKPRIEARSGSAIPAEEVRVRLAKPNCSVGALFEELICYPSVDDQETRFPLWQFSADGVHQWVPQLLGAYGHNGWGLIDFLTVPRLTNNGRSYLQLLLEDDKATPLVLDAARRSNPD
jgi:hypothetical protein